MKIALIRYLKQKLFNMNKYDYKIANYFGDKSGRHFRSKIYIVINNKIYQQFTYEAAKEVTRLTKELKGALEELKEKEKIMVNLYLVHDNNYNYRIVIRAKDADEAINKLHNYMKETKQNGEFWSSNNIIWYADLCDNEKVID